MSNKQKIKGGNGSPGRGGPPPMGPLNFNEMRSFECSVDLQGTQKFCGSEHFEPVVVLKLVSALEKGNPTGKPALAPMMPPNGPFDWKCTLCGRIYTSREILGE